MQNFILQLADRIVILPSTRFLYGCHRPSRPCFSCLRKHLKSGGGGGGGGGAGTDFSTANRNLTDNFSDDDVCLILIKKPFFIDEI